MSEPWLSDLSEDWKTPSSLDSSSLPNRNYPTSSPGVPTKSRIPRLSQKSSTPKSGRAGAQTAAGSSKKTLSERSHSDINIPSRSSSAPRPIKATSKPSHPSSESSAGSVVKLDTAARKARGNSPAKAKIGTPEWRKIILKGQENPAQNNLFSSMGLESIFLNPNSVANHVPPKPRQNFSLLQDLDSMPSSPPPWPKINSGSHMPSSGSSQTQKHKTLDVLEEQDEREHMQSSEISDSENPVGSNSSAPAYPSAQGASSQIPAANIITGLDGSSDIDHAPVNLTSPLHDGDDQLQRNNRYDADDASVHVKKEGSSTNGNTSSVVGGFSPVFISKHNTADGRIDYTPVDLSDPAVLQQLRESHGRHTSDAEDTSATEMSSEHVEYDYPVRLKESGGDSGRGNLQPIGEFVSTKRGGLSEVGSFRRRPLSPSASSSIVPSDSVSQVHNSDSRPHLPAGNAMLPEDRNSPIREANNGGIVPRASRQRQDSDEEQLTLNIRSEPDQRAIEEHPLLPKDGNDDIWRHEQASMLENNLENASNKGSSTAQSLETVLHRSNSARETTDDAIHDSSPCEESPSTETGQLASCGPWEVRRPHTPDTCAAEPSEYSPNKRTAPVPSQSPTPKRIRTIVELEQGPHPEYVSDVVAEQHRQMQAIIGKRKDARYDDVHLPCDPDALAKREILRPRNLVSGPAFSQRLATGLNESLDQQSVLSNATLMTVREHIEQADLQCDATEEANIKALASEVATMRLRDRAGPNGEVRKQSVSTQDYVDEAMKIMELIRSNRMPRTELSNLDESDLGTPGHVDAVAPDEMAPQTISRTPSREGAVNAWRTEDSRPLNDDVANQLKKFQENEDESFMATSTFGELDKESAELEAEQAAVDEQSANIRILPRIDPDEAAADSSLDNDIGSLFKPHSPPKTYSSNKSTDSSGRTAETTSTQKTRTLPVIGPERVSHLLKNEQAGMRYDAERQTWVKCKSREAQQSSPGHLSTSSQTDEDDPFGAISDLSVNHGEPKDFNEEQNDQFLSFPDELELHGEVQHYDNSRQDWPHDSTEPQTFENNDSDDLPHSAVRHVDGRHWPEGDNQKLSRDEKDAEEVDRDWEPPISSLHLTTASKAHTPLTKFAKVPASSVRSKRRNVSVLFSSPPVVNEFEPTEWSDQSGNPDFAQVNRELSLSCIDEHREISFIGTRPDGRSMSLTLSISTPLPSHRNCTRPIVPSSGLRNSNLWNSLSPLSEFSFHQDDARHLKARHLIDGQSKEFTLSTEHKKPAVVLEELVRKLTDVEPDEPYWDFMRALHLERKELANLHMLDEFCPRIEELNVSENSLQHLTGAPASLRQLVVKNNMLSGLSSWQHLLNLQYLDISGNAVESLEAFSSLVHLRELKLDDNNVASLDGLLDLDGLLSVSLRRNKVQSLDFAGTEMKRLSKLDMRGNSVRKIFNIHCLPSLTHLDLGDNNLESFPCQVQDVSPSASLQSLLMPRNKLKSVDVALLPNLRLLDLDGNRLCRVGNVAKLRDLECLLIRSQKPLSDSPSISDFLDEYSEISHLYLSGNLIPKPQLDHPFLNLKTLELASAGVQSLQPNFALMAPNLRVANLNSNGLKDLRPLRGIEKLKQLYVAGNRLTRLRKTIKSIGALPMLQELDLRDNPLTLSYYPLFYTDSVASQKQISRLEDITTINTDPDQPVLQHILPFTATGSKDQDLDSLHYKRLDEDTRLRRRLYDLLIGANCPTIELLDGRTFERSKVLKVDGDWEQLVELGVIERAGEDQRVF